MPPRERNSWREGTSNMGEIWGYDPGGNGKHGVAKLILDNSNLPQQVLWDTVNKVEDAIHWFGDSKPLGFGVDTLTAWSSGRSGWRPADIWLRARYPFVLSSVISPNGLYSSMTVNGMLLVSVFRSQWPELLVSETHPVVMQYALSLHNANTVAANAVWNSIFGVALPPVILHSHAWAALMSTFPLHMFLFHGWTNDLHTLPVPIGERLIHPANPTKYIWI
jgi:hypothetical protein